MLTPLLTVLPIFALIFAGWLARRLGALGPQSTSELNRFVVWLALPALLFHIVATAHPRQNAQHGAAADGLARAAFADKCQRFAGVHGKIHVLHHGCIASEPNAEIFD